MRLQPCKENKGLSLRARDDMYPVANLSFMDAAHLLFDLKDFLQGETIGRGALDEVARRRRQRVVRELRGT